MESGVAVGFATELLLNVAVGVQFQEAIKPPVAFKSIEVPKLNVSSNPALTGTTGSGLTITVYVAVGAIGGTQGTVLETVIVKVIVVPASAKAGKYVGVNVVPFEIVPAPFEVQRIVPFVAVAPLTIAESPIQIVCVPPADAVGNGLTFTV